MTDWTRPDVPRAAVTFDSGPVGLLSSGALVGGGRFAIVEDLAHGAGGTVYKATDLASGAFVALKVLEGRSESRADAEPRLLAEAEYARALGLHPNIVQPVAWGHLEEAGGRAFMATEYVDGPTLSAYADATIPMLEKCRALRDLANVVAQLHAKSIVHRDIKPDNVMLATEGGQVVPKLTDFGLAGLVAQARAEGSPDLTGVHDRPGTKHYMAPEQCMGYPVAPAFDVYALGVSAYELFAGTPPWGSNAGVEVVLRKCDASQPSFTLSRLGLTLPEGVAELVDAALRFDGNQRPTAATFRDAMAAVVVRLELADTPRRRRAHPERHVEVTELGPRAGAIEVSDEARARTGDTQIAIEVPDAKAAPRDGRVRGHAHPYGDADEVIPASVHARSPLQSTPGTRVRIAVAAVSGAAAIAVILGLWAISSLNVAGTGEPAASNGARSEMPPASPTERDVSPLVVAAPRTEPSTAPSPARTEPEAIEPRPAPPSVVREPETPTTAKPAAASAPALHTTAACVERRAAAEAAHRRGEFSEALAQLDERSCWSDRRAHTRLLVSSLAQSGSFRRCVAAAKGSKDPAVIDDAETCRLMLEEGQTP